MSRGSNPATTCGTWCTSETGSNILVPVMTATWPGMMNPSILFSPRSKSACMMGGQILWQLYTLKFSGQSSLLIGTAVEGAVVSNPTPTKTSGLSGWSLAIWTASSMEYTILTSAPSALASNSEPTVVGTLIRSPKAVTVTPLFRLQ